MASDPEQVQAVFLKAVELPPAERPTLLDRECAGDAELRRRVETLLLAHDQSGSFLDEPVGPGLSSSATHPDGPDRPRPPSLRGTHIGPYQLLQQVGEGGMGAVWVAEQERPVKRRVALKLIRPGMDSAQIVRRFEVERQALALMSHTHIARVLDAGTTPEGRPYFVMELVQGVPLTQYCDEQRLPVRERLALFVPVCQAIQHAHQKGIIHRDVKPSNVLVTLQDGRPVPKVIDFGIAKAIGERLTDASLFTAIGQVVGTLDYMAPEQADPGALDVDTRADVYALGALLYELLTGTTPLNTRQLKGASLLEVLRVIREEEPPRPSARLADAQPSLAREVRGDLDWIAMKALEKDRTRRYETATDLAQDVERHLADEPVEACPPGRAYRVRKFLRKHRAGVLTAAALAALLIVGAAISTWQAVRATAAEGTAVAERDEKEKARALAANRLVEVAKEKRRADEKAGIAQAVTHFLQYDLLRQADSTAQAYHDVAADPNLTVRTALDRAAARIGNRFRDQPLVEAAIRQVIGHAYNSIGEPRRGVSHLERARALFAGQLGPDDPDTLLATHNLAAAYHEAGKYAQALPLYEQVLAAEEKKLGADHPDTLVSMNNLAVAHLAAGKLDRALKLADQALTRAKAGLGPDDPKTLLSMHTRATVYWAAGQLDRALPLFELTLTKTEKTHGPGHPATLRTMHSLARAYLDAGKLAPALKLLEPTFATMKVELGPDDSRTLLSMETLALAYRAAGDLNRALPLLEQALAKLTEKLGPDHPHTLHCMNRLAGTYVEANRLDRALPLCEQVLAKSRETLGSDHPETLTGTNNLAAAYYAAGRLDRAVPLFEEALAKQTKILGPDHPGTLTTMHNLAGALVKARTLDRALPLCEQVLAKRQHKLGPDHPDTLSSMNNLAGAYQDAGKHAQALPLFEDTLARQQKILGPDHPHTLLTMNNLGGAYQSMKQRDRAIPLFEGALRSYRSRPGPPHPEMFVTMLNLGVAYRDAGRLAEAIPLLEEAHRQRRRHPALVRAGYELLKAYAEARKPDEAAALVPEAIATARKQHPEGSPQLANVLAISGTALLQGKAFARAEPILKECLTIRQEKQPNTWMTFNAQSLLGGALLGQQQHAAAEPLLLRGCIGMQRRAAKIPEQNRKTLLTEAAERLVQLYDAWCEWGEAARRRNEWEAARKAAGEPPSKR